VVVVGAEETGIRRLGWRGSKVGRTFVLIGIAILGVDVFGPAFVPGTNEFEDGLFTIIVVIVAAAEVVGGVFHAAVSVATAGKVPT
jgi:hypothetical protein